MLWYIYLFISSLIHSFRKYLLITQYVHSTMLSAGSTWEVSRHSLEPQLSQFKAVYNNYVYNQHSLGHLSQLHSFKDHLGSITLKFILKPRSCQGALDSHIQLPSQHFQLSICLLGILHLTWPKQKSSHSPLNFLLSQSSLSQ